jgi:hypothetical protein
MGNHFKMEISHDSSPRRAKMISKPGKKKWKTQKRDA